MAEQAEEGSTVKVHYTGRLDNGEVFDSSEGKEPLEFELGSGSVIKGFEEAVHGMEVGEEKEVRIEKQNAYGDRNPDLVQQVPREQFGDMEPEEGMVMAFRSPDVDQDIPAKIVEVGDEEVTIDMNPPLAGEDLNFEIELVDVE